MTDPTSIDDAEGNAEPPPRLNFGMSESRQGQRPQFWHPMTLDPDPLTVLEPEPPVVSRRKVLASPGYAKHYEALADEMVPRSRPRPFTRRWRAYVRRTPTLWFLWTPVGRVLEKRLHRWKPWRDWTARGVWGDLDRIPGWNENIDAAMADLDAGRAYLWDHGATRPADSWKADDPIQPEGWRHDGMGWVRE